MQPRPDHGWLIGFRALQAIGGSMLNPVAMSIITNVFTERAERAKAIGVWGSVIGLSMALGPLVGGLLVDTVGWRSVFWLNVPVVVAVVVLTARFVPESRAPRARRFDPAGQLLMIVLLGGVTFGIIEGPGRGWGSPLIVGSFVAGRAGAGRAAVGGVAARRAAARPALLREHPVLGRDAHGGGRVRRVRRVPLPQRALPAGRPRVLAAARRADHAADGRDDGAAAADLRTDGGQRGTRLPLVIGGLGIAAAGFLLLGLDASTPLALVIAAYVVFGLGFGMINAPITNTAVSGMPLAQAGVAAGLRRRVGRSVPRWAWRCSGRW